MKHLFVPHKLALLAKDKGFDESVCAIYNLEEKLVLENLAEFGFCNNYHKDTVAAPLYQQITDWFREKHNYHFIVIPEYYKGGKIKSFGWEITNWKYADSQGGFKTYFLANDKMIEEAFKLI